MGRTRTTILQSTGRPLPRTFLQFFSLWKPERQGERLNSSTCGSHIAYQTADPSCLQQICPGTIQRKRKMEGFKIDTMGTYHGMMLESVTEGGAAGETQTPTAQPVPRPISQARPPPHQKKGSQNPIIIIPAAATSLITMLNAKDLLQDLTHQMRRRNRAADETMKL
ncbi:hypothetical protein QTO34_018528 [Cnephaeus nilssonii]|uniref:Uncharacterized protein n=1 Tax=Cnephaeus nilssonii TaxID=3371016 RepID=A0AA40HZ02_CNENI|nr:hypothetical protein QTO34_018528 [Eptesicus nilssonii]